MNKDLMLISGGVLGGATSRGIAGVFPATANPKIVHGLLALGMGFGATKVNGTSAQAQLLKGALIGGAVVKGLDLIKAMIEGTAIANKITGSDSKMNSFLRSATGLGCPMDRGGLNAVMLGSDGNYYQYDQSGLQGTYLDESGMVHQITDGLNAGEEMVYYDQQGNVVGLGYADEEEMLNGYDEQEGLYGADERDLIY
ncbi:hypothetical protein [Flavobacterium sp.]|uniref:hypothetical protein n=1 Tax=Flavobacterium sp. TaxID=239 RepID=UPI0037505F95